MSLFLRHSSECVHMRHALFPVGRTSGMPVLILDLNADDGTAILMHIPIRLLGNLGKKDVHILQILWIIRPKSQFSPLFFLHQPVREATVPALSVRPRTDTQPYFHPGFLTAVQKRLQIPSAGEIPLTFRFLMVDPKHVRSNDVYAALLHLLKCCFPFPFRIAGEMEFSHDGQDRSVVAG